MKLNYHLIVSLCLSFLSAWSMAAHALAKPKSTTTQTVVAKPTKATAAPSSIAFAMGEKVYLSESSRWLSGMATIVAYNSIQNTYAVQFDAEYVQPYGQLSTDVGPDSLYKLGGEIPIIENQYFTSHQKVWVYGDSGHQSRFGEVLGYSPSYLKILILLPQDIHDIRSRLYEADANHIYVTTEGLSTLSNSPLSIGCRVVISATSAHSAGQGIIQAYNFAWHTYVVSIQSGPSAGVTADGVDAQQLAIMADDNNANVLSSSNFSISDDTLPESFEALAKALPQSRTELALNLAKALRSPRVQGASDKNRASFMAFAIENQLVNEASASQAIAKEYAPAFKQLKVWYAKQPQPLTSIDQIDASSATLEIAVVVLHSALNAWGQNSKQNLDFSREQITRLSQAASQPGVLKRGDALILLSNDNKSVFQSEADSSSSTLSSLGLVALKITGWLEQK